MQSASDFGQYRCLVRNRLGTDQVTFHVTEITTTSTTSTTTSTTTTTSQLFVPKVTTPRPAHNHQQSSQPPFVPWWSILAVETTTSVSQKRFIQEKEDSVRIDPEDQQRQTPLSFGSYFDHPSLAPSLTWSSSLWVTCVITSTGLTVLLADVVS
ncbi:uncharacterized protein [Cherax quadricarinatus]|uniref:uncharacterized protein n=1 Tax=Cherax quadricarinatus TaxID=27406 RepID=UPI00387E326B